VKDHLSGTLCDLESWTKNEAFDAIYPLPSLNQFDSGLRTVQELNRGKACHVEAGGYVWDTTPEKLRMLFQKAVDAGPREIYLAESLPFETKQLWKPLQAVVREFGA
jgi:hypothetical protein